MTKRVIVSGASGFTGRAVLKDFVSKGWEVIAIVRKPSGLKNELIIDLSKQSCFQSLLSIPRCDAIIHLASKVDFSSDADPDSFIPINVLLTTYLSQLAKQWSSHLVFTSGILVYGDMEHIDIFSAPQPNNEYGKAKLIAESIIKSEKISHTILRIAGIYGYMLGFCDLAWAIKCLNGEKLPDIKDNLKGTAFRLSREVLKPFS